MKALRFRKLQQVGFEPLAVLWLLGMVRFGTPTLNESTRSRAAPTHSNPMHNCGQGLRWRLRLPHHAVSTQSHDDGLTRLLPAISDGCSPGGVQIFDSTAPLSAWTFEADDDSGLLPRPDQT